MLQVILELVNIICYDLDNFIKEIPAPSCKVLLSYLSLQHPSPRLCHTLIMPPDFPQAVKQVKV